MDAVEPAVALYEEPPSEGMLVATPWAEVWLSADGWAEEAAVRDRLVAQGTAVPEVQDPPDGPFGHIVVDEAQELSDAEWQMPLARCPSGSFTIVGDRAQARHDFTESWGERLGRVGHRHVEIATLTVNYRTPREIMPEAAPANLAAIPDANVPTSVRSAGVPVHHGGVDRYVAMTRATGRLVVLGEA